MKRIMLIPTAVMLLMLAACTNTPSAVKPVIDNSFTCDASLTTGELETQGQLTRYADGTWSVLFSEPTTLAGVQLDYFDDDVKASYKGLEFSIPKDALPMKSALGAMLDVLDEAAEADELEATVEDELLEVSGEHELGAYILRFSADTNTIVEFDMPSLELLVCFDEIKPLETSAETTVASETTSAEASESASETTEAT